MNNNNTLRKTLIALLAIVTIIVVILWLRSIFENESKKSQDTAPAPTVAIQPSFELVEDGKFAVVSYSSEGFSQDPITVPIGGVLQVNNQTDSEVMFTINRQGYTASVLADALSDTFSPVFTEKGEYEMSIFEGLEIESSISTRIIVE